MKKLAILTIAALIGLTGPSIAGDTASKSGSKSYIVNLKDGDMISSPVKIIFGLTGMGVAPAGIEKKHTGHHHIFLDRPPLGLGADGKDEYTNNIPGDEHHIHFGGGQTEKVLKLAPGKHTLQMVLADHNHIPHNPPVVSKVITITVK